MTAALTVAMTPAMRAEIEAEAIAEGVSAADVIRMALSAELPRMSDRRRKRAGRDKEERKRPGFATFKMGPPGRATPMAEGGQRRTGD